MKLLTTLFLLGSSNAHRWQASDSCGYIVGGSHNHVARAVRELDCSNYMRATVTPSYIASGYFKFIIQLSVHSTNIKQDWSQSLQLFSTKSHTRKLAQI